jgi:hypothetical protein
MSRSPFQPALSVYVKSTAERGVIVSTRRVGRARKLQVTVRLHERDLQDDYWPEELQLEHVMSAAEIAAMATKRAERIAQREREKAEMRAAYAARLEADRQERARLAGEWAKAEIVNVAERQRISGWHGGAVAGVVALLGPTVTDERRDGSTFEHRLESHVDWSNTAERGPQVNWSAWGTTDVAAARAYAKAILAACDIAEAAPLPTREQLAAQDKE